MFLAIRLYFGSVGGTATSVLALCIVKEAECRSGVDAAMHPCAVPLHSELGCWTSVASIKILIARVLSADTVTEDLVRPLLREGPGRPNFVGDQENFWWSLHLRLVTGSCTT